MRLIDPNLIEEDSFARGSNRRMKHDASSFGLQPLVFPASDQVAELYVVNAGGNFEFFDGSLKLSAKHVFDFDTLINAFFEHHWRRWAKIKRTILQVAIDGDATIRVFRTDARNHRQLILRVRLTPDQSPAFIQIPESGSGNGRLSFQIEVGPEDVTLSSGSWSTDVAPVRSVSLDIVMCTFNKPTFVRDYIETAARFDALGTTINRLFVVDQGTERVSGNKFSKTTQDLLAAGKITLVEQPNQGGTGGFVRGILESLRSESSPCTHILLTDDDVRFEPRLLERLINLLSRCAEDAVVGGSMLDLLHPSRLYSFVETFDFDYGYCTRLAPFDEDVSKQENLSKLMTNIVGNYNGWFLCCFPRDTFVKHGFPLPFFVRGDDCEFGTRLTQRGTTLIHMPGFFVWHEPFYGKPRAWIEYYSHRNQLIVVALNASSSRRDFAFRYLARFWFYASTFQYASAWAIWKSLEDYLAGPEKIFTDLLDRHAALHGQLADFSSLSRLANPHNFAGRKDLMHPAIPNFAGWIVSVIWNLFFSKNKSNIRVRNLSLEQVWWRSFFGYDACVVTIDAAGESIYYERDPAIARKLLANMFKTCIKFLVNARRIKRKYQDTREKYGSEESWNSLLRIDYRKNMNLTGTSWQTLSANSNGRDGNNEAAASIV